VALFAVACSPAGVESLGFGTGGTGCQTTGTASTFPVGTVIHMAASFSPVPQHVDIKLTKDGVEDPHSGSIDLGGSDNCITNDFADLEPGHYLMTLTPTPAGGMPALTGSFDVTP
jgi:hypothetical protein